MDRFKFAHISFVPRILTTSHLSSKVAPIYDKEQQTVIRSSPNENMGSTSIHSSEENEQPSSSSPSTQHFKMTKRDAIKQGITCSQISIIILAILLTLCIVAALVIDIYLLTHQKTTTIPIASLRWNSTGITIAGVTGQTGTAANLLRNPYGLAFDSSNALYIVESVNNRTQKWPMGATAGSMIAGQANGTQGTTAYDLNLPSGIYIDSNDNVYIADRLNNRIQLWTNGKSSGQTLAGSSIGTGGSTLNLLNNPYGVTYDPNSDALYIADTGNHRVMRYIINQTSGTLILGGQGAGTNSTQLNLPIGIYFDAFTNSLFIANYGAHNIVHWALDTNMQTVVAGDSNGLNGNTSTMLSGPVGVTLDPLGNMYVADSNNQRIQLFLVGHSTGITVAGTTGIYGSTASLFCFPYWVILDKQLNLYVSDTANHRVQKFVRY